MQEHQCDKAMLDLSADLAAYFGPGNDSAGHALAMRFLETMGRSPGLFISNFGNPLRDMNAAIRLLPPGYYWLIGHGRFRPQEPLGGCMVYDPEVNDPDSPDAAAKAETVNGAICMCALQMHRRHQQSRAGRA